ncbi:hypothetical protein PM082_007989 [Marasmius tenuissimus]|nr:hypothetical protein PM082_007989 [Marasmius tenuissimus]
MAVNDLESTHVSKAKNEHEDNSVVSTSSLADSRSALLKSVEKVINSYSSSAKPPVARGSFDLVASLAHLFNAIARFPAIPNVLLLDAYDLEAEHIIGSEEYRSLPLPEIPRNAIAAQLKYRKESTRQLIIYGRGRYNFGITPNSQDGIHYAAIFNKYSKNLPYNVVEEDQRKIADAPDIRMIWEFYEQSALCAGVSREDVGKQFEAEWGVNMHECAPPRLSKDPETRRLIELWERKRASLYKECRYPVLEGIRSAGMMDFPVDRRGRIVWDEKKFGIFRLIVTKIDKESGEERGDLPMRE